MQETEGYHESTSLVDCEVGYCSHFTPWVFIFPITAFVLAWANINSGYWHLKSVSGVVETIHASRALMPYVLPLFGLFCWNCCCGLRHVLNPVYWLLLYGAAALTASVLSPKFEPAFYFGAAFLMCVLIPSAFFCGPNMNERHPERVLLCATWIILAVYVVAIFAVCRDQLGGGYGIYNRYKEGIGGMSMSRSSGLARFFGVAGLLCLSRLWQGNAPYKWLFALPLAFCGWVVWSMQSRGGMFGFFAGVLLILGIGSSSRRVWVLVGAVLAALILISPEKQNDLLDRITTQVSRGQDAGEFVSMSGRTRAYAAGMREIAENPILGQGNWADRLTIGEHVHNTYLQALMNAGIVGFVPFMMSWIVGWVLFYRLYRMRAWMEPEDRQLFLEAAAVMTFFTVRSIPETTTASFSVDSMIMVPVYLYLFVLHQRLVGAWQVVPASWTNRDEPERTMS